MEIQEQTQTEQNHAQVPAKSEQQAEGAQQAATGAEGAQEAEIDFSAHYGGRIDSIQAFMDEQAGKGAENPEGVESTAADGANGQESGEGSSAEKSLGEESSNPDLADLPDKIAEKITGAWAKLNQRDAQIRADADRNKVDLAELERLKKLEADLTADPYATVEGLGGNLDEWATRTLQEGKPGESERIRKLDAEITELRDTIKTITDSKEIEKEKTELDKQIGSYLTDFDKLTTEREPERYAPIKQYVDLRARIGAPVDLHSMVQTLALDYAEKHGKALSIPELAEVLRSTAADKLAAVTPQNQAQDKGQQNTTGQAAPQSGQDSDTRQTAAGSQTPQTTKPTHGLQGAGEAVDLDLIQDRDAKLAAILANR